MQGTNLGGMEQASLKLMKGLQKVGCDTSVISLNPLGSLEPLLKESLIECKGLPYVGKGGLISFPVMFRTVRYANADALIMTGHNLLAMFALKRKRNEARVLAMHFHHAGVKSEYSWKLIYREAINKFDYITFPSDYVRKEAETIAPFIKKCSYTVRNIVTLNDLISREVQCRARHKLNIPLDATVIGNAGWLIKRKRFDVFLQVADKVLKKNPDTIFLIAGDGPENEYLRKLAKDLGINDRIVWLGWQADLRAFYQSIDLILFNSDWDAMGLAPLEAVSYGIPVVASVVNGGLNEILRNGVDAIIYNEHRVADLANDICDIISDGKLRLRFVSNARRRLQETSTEELIVEWHRKAFAGEIRYN